MATSTLFTDVRALKPSSVCIFSACAAPGIGGAERYAIGLATGIAQLGHQATLVAAGEHERFVEAERYGVRIVHLPGPTFPGVPLRNAHQRDALRHLENRHFDYVVVNGRFGTMAHDGLRFAREQGIRPAVIEHSSVLPDCEPLLTTRAHEAANRMQLGQLERYRPCFFGVSKKANALLERCGVQPCGTLPSAIDADAFVAQASSRDFREELGIPKDALFVAAPELLALAKNPLALAEPIADLATRGAGIHAVFAGTDAQRTRLSHLEGRGVHAVDPLSRPDLAALLLQADICFLSAHAEAFSICLLQAAACGTAAAATEVGGTDELILGRRYGMILANTEARTVARALVHARNERKLTAMQGRLLAQRVRDTCTWDRTAAAALLACRQTQEERGIAAAEYPSGTERNSEIPYAIHGKQPLAPTA